MSQNSRSAVRFVIVTEYPEEISQAIIRNLHHSTTLIPAKGMYSGKDVSILVCVINKAQVAELAAIVRSFPHSFVIMSHVSQVIGNFKKVDSHGKFQQSLLDELEL
jgi:uncharacterized membrane-anchored protein YitT (DUF2179 family)